LSQKIKSSGWCSAPGNLSRNGLKPTPLMSPTLETKFKTFQFFFHCNQEDLPHLLTVVSVRTAFKDNRLMSYGAGKW